MKNIVIAPTYNYLCEPLIDKVIELFGKENTFHLINLSEENASYGITNIDSTLISSSYDFKSKSLNGLTNIIEKRKLLRHLKEISPSHIITFSDVTSFARFIKGSEHEKKTIVIQPCLLDMRELSIRQKGIYLLRKLVNKTIAQGGIKSNSAFGETLKNSTYLVWSKIERDFLINKRVNVLISGKDMTTFPNRKNLKKSKDVIVIAPHFNLYNSKKLVDDYFSSLSKIIKNTPNFNFKIKYHPTNTIQTPNIERAQILNKLNNEQLEKSAFIISGHSNLAIISSFLNDDIFILEAKKYESKYITKENFHFIDIDQPGNIYHLLSSSRKNTIIERFSPSSEYIKWKGSLK